MSRTCSWADISTPQARRRSSLYPGSPGGVDILINNVGGSSAPGGGFAALTDDDWQAAVDQNLLAAVVSMWSSVDAEAGFPASSSTSRRSSGAPAV